jgi:hypothetical protein
MPIFKAIELDPVSRQRTGREHILAVETRQAAIDGLLLLLQAKPDAARVDPTRTMLQLNAQLWTIVSTTAPQTSPNESSALRRGGAKHRRVR